MAEKSNDNFWGGFLLGAVIGGTTAAIVTKLLSNSPQLELDQADLPSADSLEPAEPGGESMRENLEQKIVQLNQAIDAVSHELQQPSLENGNNLDAHKP
ncbi:MAG: hypothetical protein SFT94_01720 [Pseudanabaenaceae cyanobacterium bins.68]|nr:hypothetical protein [Pseudanabaenaceae cyanobacterium bins.68]